MRNARFVHLLAGLLLLAACSTMPAAPASEPLRAMTFNIRYGTAQDGDNAWQLRRPLTFRAIRDYAPNVLSVQEALRFQLDEIRRELPQYGEIGVGRDDGVAKGEYSAILFDRRRLTPLESGTSGVPLAAGRLHRHLPCAASECAADGGGHNLQP